MLLLLLGIMAKLAPLLASLFGPKHKRYSAQADKPFETVARSTESDLERAARVKWHVREEDNENLGEERCDDDSAPDAECLRISDGYRRD
ncbi:hypothetical protein [Cohaesibacter sp. ES.047]|uniref:hypothetical protein n=1 Tax=Cohaesibacter sp. ES.047 TaxID=1798205 RepID=UPI001560DB19|nr:hypothetical protein [Cohaesibacter sp. ES.047]